jgi:hypothetical protein
LDPDAPEQVTQTMALPCGQLMIEPATGLAPAKTAPISR